MILDQIVAHKQKEVEQLKKGVPLAVLKECVKANDPPRGFRQALVRSPQISLIAEIKKASPSAGLIRKDADPVTIAKIYEHFGAAAVSVLTDGRFFQGTLDAMNDVKKAISIPVLRKDFIVDPYQIYEARSFGADAVLLIVAILSEDALRALLKLCGELGLDALVEVHTELERDKALETGAGIIGINNRDLTTFAVDLSTTKRLASGIPEDVLCISESGISCYDDIRYLRKVGVDAVLVGTALMEAHDIGAKIEKLFNSE